MSLLLMGAPAVRADVDLTGVFTVDLNGIDCTVDFTQSGTALSSSGFCASLGVTFTTAGTIDPRTGVFTVTGTVATGPNPCTTGFAINATASADSSSFSGTFVCTPASGNFPVSGSRVMCPTAGCGSLDPCHPGTCDPVTAICSYPPAPDGTPCDDGSACTQADACLRGVCTGTPVKECAHRACDATCKRDVARCMATQCTEVGPKACRRRCKPAAIRTLAYVLSECRVDAAGFLVARQALRIRRGDREPITVVEFPPSEPVPDPQGLCRGFGASVWGSSSVVVFPLQRLGVSPDGSGIVFEVNDDFLFSRLILLPPERKGFFFVRSDGHGLRRLGPASRDPSFRLGQDFINGSKDFWKAWVLSPPILFSPNGRRIAFTDLGPGPSGEEAVQIVVLDLATGKRRQVTQLPSGIPPQQGPDSAPYFLTCCPQFIDNETIRFQTFVDAGGLNPEHNFAAFTVGVDGSRLKALPTPVALPDSHLVPSFAVTGAGTNLVRLNLPGTPVSNVHPPLYHFPIAEVFLQDGKDILQLTKLDREDTFIGFLNPTRTRAFFLASADPLGTNPEGYCQIFSMDTLGPGRRLRQVTHLNSRVCPPLYAPGCFQGQGIGYGYYRVVFQDPVTQAVVFDSSCDPLGANGSGYQVFATRPDGDGLRQLTDAYGVMINPDGSFRVELPGPFAYSAALH